jgi:hypothetical protein
MHRSRNLITPGLLLLLASPVCLPEEKPSNEPHHFFQLDFTVKELEGGKVVNSRAYSMQIADKENRVHLIRTVSRIPAEVASGNWQFIDVGTSFDCNNLKLEPDGTVSFDLGADISSVPDDQLKLNHPTIRQNRWNSTVNVKLKTRTVVFSSDDMSSRRNMQVEVTAIPVTQAQ